MPASLSVPPPRPHTLRFGLLAGALLIMAVASACVGSVSLSPQRVGQAIFGSADVDPILRQIVVDFRLPRIATAMLAGAALATAGLMMQTICRNPLADPFVLGVNSGASLGVAILLLALAPSGLHLTAGLNSYGQTLLVLASSGGAALTLFIVLSLSRKVDVMSVLIIGLMISYTVGALVSLLMYFSMAERLQAFLSWSFGDYGSVNWGQMTIFAATISAALSISLLLVKPLDALLLGERYAASVGTRTQTARTATLLTASVLAGTVTGFCGPIGFLGIAAPHLSRYLFRTSSHRVLIPAAILLGALLSLSADFIARGPGLELSLPLNAITALIGAPVIIAALIKQRNLQRLFG
mgnify:CR=1 FL=1